MRIFVEARSPVLLFALGVLIRTLPGWVVVGVATNPADVIKKVKRGKPDVILLDLNGEGQIAEAIISVKSTTRDAVLIVLGTDPILRQQVLEWGADYFFCKANSPDKLIDILKNCDKSQSENIPSLD
jgi:DNA-binding NarL/FixJ family response regulator